TVRSRPSFRVRLARRFALIVLGVVIAASLVTYLAVRTLLHEQLDQTLIRLASIEAGAAADSPDSTVHFHDDVFSSGGPGQEVLLSRYAQVWSLGGEPVVRTENLGSRDLPLPASVRQNVLDADDAELFGFTWEGASYRSVLYPLGQAGPQHHLHLLQVAASTAPVETVLRRLLVFLGLLTVGSSALGLFLGRWMASTALRPVLEVIHQAERIEMTGGDTRIDAAAETEEMGRLIEVLNSMLTRIDRAFDSLRRFLADVGHEIRTPLTVLRGDIEVALRRPRSEGEYEEILRQSLEDLREASALADDLITLARGEGGLLKPVLVPVDARALLDRVAYRYRGAAEEAGARLTVDDGAPLFVPADATLLERAVGNLVDNATKYGGGEIRLECETSAEGDIALRIKDRGAGIPDDQKARMLERYQRGTDADAGVRGSGLGLSIAKVIVEEHGGSIRIDDRPGGGSDFVILLPGVTTGSA
ncbi:MAG: sensor histidine kinase, partial [Gemmatimonadota bacterium]